MGRLGGRWANNYILNNTISNAYYYGIFVQYQNFHKSNGNIIKLLAGNVSSMGVYFNYVDAFELKQNNINFRYFSPLFSANSFYLGRRLHHKIIVADGACLLYELLQNKDEFCLLDIIPMNIGIGSSEGKMITMIKLNRIKKKELVLRTILLMEANSLRINY